MRSLASGLNEPPREPAETEVALRQWRDAVMLAGDLSLRERVVVANTHYQLMVIGVRALEAVEVHGTSSAHHLVELARASQDWWLETARNLADQAVGVVVEHSDRLSALSVASVDLCHEFAAQASSRQIASAMLYTGFGGSSVVADSVAPASCWPKPTPRGEDGAHAIPARLEQVSLMAVAAGIRVSDRASDRDSRAKPVELSSPTVLSPRTDRSTVVRQGSPEGPLSPPEPLWASKEPMSREACEEAARRRDVGILARAALEGRPDAIMLTSGVSTVELKALVQDGDQARADLMGSVWRRLNYEKHGTFTWDEAEERMGHATLRLAEAVDRWDPKRGAWTTLAFAAIRYARLETTGERIKRREREKLSSLSEDHDLHAVDQAHQRATSQGLADPVAHMAETNVATAKARRLIDRLPEQDQRLVTGYLGLGSGKPKQMTQLAAEEGIHASTVKRRIDRAVGQLTTWMNDGLRRGESPNSTLVSVRKNDRLAQSHHGSPTPGGPSR